jgi:hypothetical protein
MFILRILFYFIIFGLLAILFVFLFIGLAVRKLKNKTRQPRDSQPRQATQADGSVIIDRRPAEEIGKKIIPKDEGEYVDYEDA